MMVTVYYIPLWCKYIPRRHKPSRKQLTWSPVQAVKGVGPVDSGIYTIPLVASLVVAGIMGAAFTQRIGYYVPTMIACPCIMAIGEGLLSTFTPSTGHSQWIGFQFLTGFGLGLGMLTVSLAFQATLPKEDLPTGIAISFFGQQLGGAVFVSVGQTILNSVLNDDLKGIPGLDAKTIVNSGATKLHEVVPAKYMGQVISGYNHAITRIFIASLALSAVQLLFACCVEWKSIKKPPGPPAADNAPAEEQPKSEEK
jgi:MFS family permease